MSCSTPATKAALQSFDRDRELHRNVQARDRPVGEQFRTGTNSQSVNQGYDQFTANARNAHDSAANELRYHDHDFMDQKVQVMSNQMNAIDMRFQGQDTEWASEFRGLQINPDMVRSQEPLRYTNNGISRNTPTARSFVNYNTRIAPNATLGQSIAPAISDRQFEAAFVEAEAAASLKDAERSQAEESNEVVTKAHPSPGGDELAETAGQLYSVLNADESQKFKDSKFLLLMRQLRDREKVVHNQDIVSAFEATPSAENSAAMGSAHLDSVRGATADAEVYDPASVYDIDTNSPLQAAREWSGSNCNIPKMDWEEDYDAF
ncbi:hypothetical protein CANCADRAFT_140895 [Tortispora caseinolytica NRRL Y-17796]|uniref:Peroxin 20 n=1 Tax=Tortispora caseinolytica NRRL Y-17796 TaxID=767744 RepID=A0A1E4TCS6_9ASCO|nr:hypothetical protein CANCADRAFT_140895 [Tortispora caseinolytica NRRL Y-17796]